MKDPASRTRRSGATRDRGRPGRAPRPARAVAPSAGPALAGRGWAIAIAAVVAIALGWRIAYLVRLAGTPLGGSLIADSRAYWDWAGLIVRNGPVGASPFFLAPLYPYAIAPLRALFGESVQAVLVVQALWGAAAAGLIADAARRLTRPWIGLGAGLMVAFYEMAVFFDGLVLIESLVFFLEALLLWLVVRTPWPEARWTRYAVVGLVIGLLAEGRATAALLLPAAWLCLAWRREDPPTRGLPRAAALLAGFALVVAPVALRTLVVTGEWIPFTYNGGFNLYVGNSPEANGGFVSITGTHLMTEPGVEREGGTQSDGRAYLRDAEGITLSPAASSRHWADKAWRYARAHPGRTLTLAARKVGMMWNHREVAQIENVEQFRRAAGPLGLPLIGSFAFLGPLALAGLLFAPRRGPVGWFLVAWAVMMTLAIAPFFVTDRYRVHLVPCAVLLAAIAIDRLRETLAAGAPRAALPLAAALLAGLVITRLPAPALSAAKYEWGAAFDLGTRWAERGRPDLAVREYERAIALERGAPARGAMAGGERADLAYNYGNALTRLGRRDEALAAYRRAVAVAPDHVLAVGALAGALADAGRSAAAESLYRALESKAGGGALAVERRGWEAARAGRIDEAQRLFAEAVERNPGLASAWGALIRTQVQAQRLDAARATLVRARAAGLPDADGHAYEALLAALAGDAATARRERAQVPAAALASDPALADVVQVVDRLIGGP